MITLRECLEIITNKDNWCQTMSNDSYVHCIYCRDEVEQEKYIKHKPDCVVIRATKELDEMIAIDKLEEKYSQGPPCIQCGGKIVRLPDEHWEICWKCKDKNFVKDCGLYETEPKEEITEREVFDGMRQLAESATNDSQRKLRENCLSVMPLKDIDYKLYFELLKYIRINGKVEKK